MEDLKTLKGEVDSIIFKSEDTGFCVLMLNCDNDLITVVGEMGDVEEGEDLVVTGEFTSHQKFGEQFKVHIFERSLPTTSAAIQRYLASGAISGVGPVLAKKLVNKFGDDTLDIIENTPDRLTEIDGITVKKAEKISQEFKTTFAARSLMSYLNKFEIETSYGIKAWKRWGNTAEQIIKSNPYVLCIQGVDLSFSRADAVAAKSDIPADSECRIKAGITYILRQNADQGHTCLPLDSLVKTAVSYLDVDEKLIKKVIEDETEEENLYYYDKHGRRFVMLADFYKAEDYIARRLAIMRQISYDNKIDFSEVIDLEEENNGIQYEKIQREAINLALSKGFLVLTGGPGTGKTTTLNAIISLYQQQGLNVMICAPTGRAAKRLSDLTGFDAKTIHRLLEVKHTSGDTLAFIHDENNLLDCDALIIDEMSMVDIYLMHALLKAVTVGTRLILVGDRDQLPSVGPGSVLKDIIESECFPVVCLTHIFRQEGGSDIVLNAHKINKGEHIVMDNKSRDFFFLKREDANVIISVALTLIQKKLPSYVDADPYDIQVLTPMRKGLLGVERLNTIFQQYLNPPSPEKNEKDTGRCKFREGDKVMQTRNNYQMEWEVRGKYGIPVDKGCGVFNGDMGIIREINTYAEMVTVEFDECRFAEYSFKELEELELAYALTVHKAQGSEYPAVILPLLNGPRMLMNRNLLYTAVTRARSCVTIVGSPYAVNQMIDNKYEQIRYTSLRQRICEFVL